MSSVWPPYQNTGTPVTIGSLKLGQTFKHDGYPGVYTVISHDPFRVKRPDGWITRVNDLNKIVYI